MIHRFSTALAVLAAGAALSAAALSASAQPLSCTPFHSSGIYQTGEPAGWSVALAPDAGPERKFTYVIRKNNLDPIKSGTLDLSSGPASIEATINEPAMLYVEVKPESGGAENSVIHLGAAVSPEKLRPSVPRPADFDEFWSGKLAALDKVPVNPVLTPGASGHDGVDLYTVKLDSRDSHVHGYLAKPSAEGKFPALVIFQYAGVYALKPETAVKPASEGWLAFDVDSHDIPPDQADGVPRNYYSIGNTDREKCYFLDMYLRDVRAIEYISSRLDWDGRTIVIMGTSMGGQQSLVAAGLSSKVTAVIVNEPSGADSNGEAAGRRTGYPNWPSNDPQVMRTALYFDTVNFASRIKAPVLAALGFIDTTAPPVGIWTALDQIPGPKEVVPMIESDHNNRTPEKQGAYNERSREVLELILHGGTFRPKGL